MNWRKPLGLSPFFIPTEKMRHPISVTITEPQPRKIFGQKKKWVKIVITYDHS